MKFMSMIFLLFPLSLSAAEGEFAITIKDHLFEPSEIHVPAHQRVKLVISNLDATPEEFESHDLNREKIIAGSSKVTIYIGPLKPGRYPFMGEFHMDTAQGAVIAE